MIGWRPDQTILETARDADALMDGRAREGAALRRENIGDRHAPGVLGHRREAIILRAIVALHARVFPATHPADDLLRSV